MKRFSLFLLLIAIGFASCNSNRPPVDHAKQAATDDSIIQVYIKKNHITAIKDSSGLYYQVLKQGTGANATASSSVQVNYEGKMPDGTVFDATKGQPATFPLSGVIPGWTKGIPLVKAGGKILLLIPSALGYGDQSAGSIPANSVLIFNIEVLNVQ